MDAGAKKCASAHDRKELFFGKIGALGAANFPSREIMSGFVLPSFGNSCTNGWRMDEPGFVTNVTHMFGARASAQQLRWVFGLNEGLASWPVQS